MLSLCTHAFSFCNISSRALLRSKNRDEILRAARCFRLADAGSQPHVHGLYEEKKKIKK